MRFKERSPLYHIKVQNKATGNDVEAAGRNPGDVTKLASEGGHKKHAKPRNNRTLSVAETFKHWKEDTIEI